MSRRCALLLPAAALALLAPLIGRWWFAGSSTSDPGRPMGAAERAEVESAARRFLARYQEPVDDPERILEWFHDGPALAWFEDGSARYSSTAGMREALAAMPDGAAFRTTLGDPSLDPLTPDLCAVGSAFRTRIDGLGEPVEYSGVLTMLLERRDGEWAIRSGHASSAGRGARPR